LVRGGGCEWAWAWAWDLEGVVNLISPNHKYLAVHHSNAIALLLKFPIEPVNMLEITRRGAQFCDQFLV
jgi:hypothetical protein